MLLFRYTPLNFKIFFMILWVFKVEKLGFNISFCPPTSYPPFPDITYKFLKILTLCQIRIKFLRFLNFFILFVNFILQIINFKQLTRLTMRLSDSFKIIIFCRFKLYMQINWNCFRSQINLRCKKRTTMIDWNNYVRVVYNWIHFLIQQNTMIIVEQKITVKLNKSLFTQQ